MNDVIDTNPKRKALTMTTPLEAATAHAIATLQRWITAGKLRRWHIECPPVQSAIEAAFEALPVHGYWRGTNRKAEITDVRKGVQIVSKNHRDGYGEQGMSVSLGIGTVVCYGYKYAYLVSGDVVGTGSDGEPLLSNCQVRSKLLTPEQAMAQDAYGQAKSALVAQIAAATGLTADDIYRLESGSF